MLKKVLLFLAGAGIGSGITFLIMKDKNERALQQERQNMLDEIEEFKREELKESTDELVSEEEAKDAKEKLSNLVEDIKESKETVDELINKYETTEGPYIISSDEFDNKGYDLRYWYLYNDGVVVDENNDEVTTDEISYSIGDCLNGYINGEDVVYIRNDFDETDYEIKRIDEDYLVEDETDEL
jgi:hypothetical protein